MKHWLKLALPVGLGAAAAVANGLAVYPKIAPAKYLSLTRDVALGEVFKPTDMQMLEIHGDQATLPKTALPFSRAPLMYGQTARRSFAKGDLVLWQDTHPGSSLPKLGAQEVALQISLSESSPITSLMHVDMEAYFILGPDREEFEWNAASGTMQPSSSESTSSQALERVGPFRIVAIGERTDPGDETNTKRDRHANVLTIAARLHPADPKRLRPEGERLLMAANGRSNERIYNVEPKWQ